MQPLLAFNIPGCSRRPLSLDRPIRLVNRTINRPCEVATDIINNNVAGSLGVHLSGRLPSGSCYISIVHVIVVGEQLAVSACLGACANDVADAIALAGCQDTLLTGSCAVEVIDVHLVTQELWGFRRDVLHLAEPVDRIERVRGLSGRHKLVPMGPAFVNILVGQIVLWLIQQEVKLSRGRPRDIIVLISVLRPVYFSFDPYFRRGAYSLLSEVCNLPEMSDVVRLALICLVLGLNC